jgi:hypothetical protein
MYSFFHITETMLTDSHSASFRAKSPQIQDMAMIDIAAHVTNGVIIPGMCSTREEIMTLFHKQMDKLRARLHVSTK